MALRINTNIAAMSAHKSLTKTDNALSSSLERLSTGLRINKAADDASGMAIADSLRSQALGLGQAIRNGNDGIAIVQTADAALEESINIINTIKQKSIQAAQDGQTTDSRKAIQADISKLRENLDTIAKTTAFNNQKLLSGNFTDKKFQIGAYAGETIDISIGSTEANKIGHITNSNMTFAGAGVTELNVYSNLLNKSFSLNSIELAFNNKAENGVGAVADAINKLSDVLGISATASVSSSTDGHIVAGTTDSSFAINGVTIGALKVAENDATGSLVSAINNKSSQHGVTASVDQGGVLTLVSADKRAIQVTMESATQAVMGGTEDLSTLGVVKVRQEGTSQITITDAGAAAGIAVSTVKGSISVSGAATATQNFVAANGSKLTDTTLGSGTIIAGSFKLSGGTTVVGNNDVTTKGSTISSGSTIGSGTVLQGSFKVSGATATTGGNTIIAAGSTLTATTELGEGSIFKGDVSASLSGVASGDVIVSGTGANVYTKIAAGGVASVKNGVDLVLTGEATLLSGTTIGNNSILKAGSVYDGDFDVKGNTVLTGNMILKSGTTVASESILLTGSVFRLALAQGDGVVAGSMTLKTNSILGDNSVLMDGSSLGGAINLQKDVTVGYDTAMLLGAGSSLASGSTLTAGTYLTNDVFGDDGTLFKKGSTLTSDIVTGGGATAITNAMIVNGGSILKAGTTLATNDVSQADSTTSSLSEGLSYRLSDVDVTSQEGAQIGIAVADAALKALNKVRSDLGSVQNQLVSTIANISTTRVNVASAESTIRDVDFAEESSTFTKMQILSQAGTFAMSQANASAQNVLGLLQ